MKTSEMFRLLKLEYEYNDTLGLNYGIVRKPYFVINEKNEYIKDSENFCEWIERLYEENLYDRAIAICD